MRWHPYPTTYSVWNRLLAVLLIGIQVLPVTSIAADVVGMPTLPAQGTRAPVATQPAAQPATPPVAGHSPGTPAKTDGQTLQDDDLGTIAGDSNKVQAPQPQDKSVCAEINEPNDLISEKDAATNLRKYTEKKKNELANLTKLMQALEYKRQLSPEKMETAQDKVLTLDAKSIGFSLKDICRRKRAIHQRLDANIKAFSALDANRTKADACRKSLLTIKTSHEALAKDLEDYEENIEDKLKGIKELFHEGLKQNYQAIEKQKAAQPKLPQEMEKALEQEFTGVWGREPKLNAVLDKNLDFNRKGFFTSAIHSIEKERDAYKKTKSELDKMSKKIDEDVCNSNKVDTRQKPGDQQPPADNSPKKIPSYCEDPATRFVAGTNVPGKVAIVKSECQGWGVADPVVNRDPKAGDGRLDPLKKSPNQDPDDLDDSTPTAKRPPRKVTPAQAEQEESWLSKNSSYLMVGGGVAAVAAGALLYKKEQDRKDKKINQALLAAEVNMTSSDNSSEDTTATATSTSTSTTTTTSNLHPARMTVSGIPAGAQVGSNITKITVVLVDANGNKTGNSDIDVTVSCASPTPCTLTGGLTVNSNLGQAIFDDVRFTSPHKAVKLKFSAPGLPSVTSTNAFDVTQ